MSPRLQRWRDSGRSFSWGGQRLFFKDEGVGPALLLLHGYPTGSFDWHALWPRLLPHHRLIAPDFLGLGFSDKPRQHRYALGDHADAVEALLAGLGLGEVHLVAHDLGVRVAQELLARREVRPALPGIRSLVLLNGAICPEAYRPRPIQRLLASPLGEWLGPRVPRRAFDRAVRGLFGARTPPSAELLDDFWCLLEVGGGRLVTHRVGRFWQPQPGQRDRLVGALLRSRAPLRLVNGAADPNSGSHMVARWRSLAPHTDVVSLPHIGHWPQLEDPDATARAILAFPPQGSEGDGRGMAP